MNFAEEDSRLLCAVWSIACHRRSQVNNDGHSVFVCSFEDAAYLSHVLRVVEINVEVSEVQLETIVQIRIPGAPRDLGKCIVLSGSTPQNARRRSGNSATWRSVQSFSVFTRAYSSSTGGLFGLPY